MERPWGGRLKRGMQFGHFANKWDRILPQSLDLPSNHLQVTPTLGTDSEISLTMPGDSHLLSYMVEWLSFCLINPVKIDISSAVM